jgi:penicillin-binding protein 1C
VGVWVWFGPLPRQALTPATEQVQVFTDRFGHPLDGLPPMPKDASDRRDPNGNSSRGPSLAARADHLAAATIAAEDKRFNNHIGVDPAAMSRAFVADVRAGAVVQGASTLTQQLVKIRTHTDRSLGSKLNQAVYAIRLERRMTKDQILSAYLAEAPYGGRILGAESASWRYFNVTASQLSWSQAAYLAAIPQRPSAFNPLKDSTSALTRRNWILRRLHQDGKLTAQELETALKEPVVLAESNRHPLALHYIDLLKSKREVRTTQTVRTTLDAELQADVEGIAHHQRDELRKSDAANVSIVVLDNKTGAVRAWEGSGNYFAPDTGGMINGPMVPRQTGSTIKPFIYALAFQDGLSPGDLVDDSPLHLSSGSGAFDPQNYDKKFRGPISARVALGSSINVPAVALLQDIGVDRLRTELRAQGIELRQPDSTYGLSLALGTGEISLLDLTRAYASFARGGRAVTATLVEPAIPQTGGARVVSETSAFMVTDVLADNEARAMSFGRDSVLKFPFPVAAKTGTSQDFHDNWVIGYTADFTVGVWVGNFDRTPLKGATGITGAGPIFQSVMIAAHDHLSPPTRVGARNASTRGVSPGATLLGMAPPSLRLASFCTTTSCTSRKPDWTARAVMPSTNRAATTTSGIEFRLIEPSAGATYVIDSTRPLDTQELGLESTGGDGTIELSVDGVTVRRFWPLAPGRHKACATDSARPTKSVCHTFTVRG